MVKIRFTYNTFTDASFFHIIFIFISFFVSMLFFFFLYVDTVLKSKCNNMCSVCYNFFLWFAHGYGEGQLHFTASALFFFHFFVLKSELNCMRSVCCASY